MHAAVRLPRLYARTVCHRVRTCGWVGWFWLVRYVWVLQFPRVLAWFLPYHAGLGYLHTCLLPRLHAVGCRFPVLPRFQLYQLFPTFAVGLHTARIACHTAFCRYHGSHAILRLFLPVLRSRFTATRLAARPVLVYRYAVLPRVTPLVCTAAFFSCRFCCALPAGSARCLCSLVVYAHCAGYAVVTAYGCCGYTFGYGCCVHACYTHPRLVGWIAVLWFAVLPAYCRFGSCGCSLPLRSFRSRLDYRCRTLYGSSRSLVQFLRSAACRAVAFAPVLVLRCAVVADAHAARTRTHAHTFCTFTVRYVTTPHGLVGSCLPRWLPTRLVTVTAYI